MEEMLEKLYRSAVKGETAGKVFPLSDVTIVIPTLNEAAGIGPLMDELRAEGYENIMVIDGYSKDETAEIARSKGAIVIPQHGAGKAGALKTAIENVETPYLLVMDGDYTYDPKDIRKLLLHCTNYDEVIGFRDSTNISPIHRLGNKAINLTFNLLMNVGLSDVCSGMYLLRTEAARMLHLRSRGFDVEVEIAAGLCSIGKVTEVPISYRKRIGREKLTWREGFKIVSSIVGLARAYNPAFFIATLASVLLLPGFIITLMDLYYRYAYGATGLTGTSWIGLIFIIIGMNSFSLATMALLVKRWEKSLTMTLRERR